MHNVPDNIFVNGYEAPDSEYVALFLAGASSRDGHALAELAEVLEAVLQHANLADGVNHERVEGDVADGDGGGADAAEAEVQREGGPVVLEPVEGQPEIEGQRPRPAHSDFLSLGFGHGLDLDPSFCLSLGLEGQTGTIIPRTILPGE